MNIVGNSGDMDDWDGIDGWDIVNRVWGILGCVVEVTLRLSLKM